MKPRLINANALIEYCQNQMDKKIDCNDIARFPTYPTDEWHYVKDGDLPEEDVYVYLWFRGNDYPTVARRHLFKEWGRLKWCWDCKWGSGYTVEADNDKIIAWKEIEPPESLCDKILENLKQNHEKYVQEEMQFHDVGIDDRFRKQQKKMEERNCENCGSVHCYSFEPKYHICKNGSLWTDREEE